MHCCKYFVQDDPTLNEMAKIRVVIFKLGLLSNCAMLIFLCGYFISSGFSPSNHFSPSFDSKMKDIILLTLFGLFAFQFELYSKLS